MGTEIEKFAEDEGKKIANAIALKKDEDQAVKHKSFFPSFLVVSSMKLLAGVFHGKE